MIEAPAGEDAGRGSGHPTDEGVPVAAPTLLRTRTAAAVPVAALLVVAVVHVGLRASSDLSPWKGGGFAMFSTVDSPGTRIVTVWADVGGGEEPVRLGDEWDGGLEELRSLPSAARTRALAAGVAASALVRTADGVLWTAATTAPKALPVVEGSLGSRRTATDPAAAPVPAGPARRVRVEVARLTYEGGAVQLATLRSATAAPGGSA